MSGRNIVLTGVPRGGTTLACKLLQQCHETVALFEPMDVTALPNTDRAQAISKVADFFASVRVQALRDGTAPSKQVAGAVPDNLFAQAPGADGQRRMLASPGSIHLQTRPSEGFTLVIKHNAAFTALLPELASRFRTLAIIRHPLSVLASWSSVDLPVSAGRLPAAERFDPVLAANLDAGQDRLTRQLCVLEWFFSRFARLLPTENVLRYEDIVASQGELLRVCAGVSGEPVAGMAERNANAVYLDEQIPRLAEALVEQGGSWQRWYPADSVAPLAGRILAARVQR